MTRSIEQIKRYRSRFGWVFLLSLLLTLPSIFFFISAPVMAPPPKGLPPPPPAFEEGIDVQLLVSIVSLLTSITSLIGFFMTNAIAWRKERRDQQNYDIDLEKKKLEIEKLRRELQRNEGPSAGNGGEP